MNAAVLDYNPSLRNARHAFDQWRSTRTRRAPTPIALRQCAVTLLDQHCALHVCRVLRINASAFKQWAEQPVPLSTSAECPVDADSPAVFVRMPEVDGTLAKPDSDMTGTLIIELPNETVIRVHRAFSLDEVFLATARIGGTTMTC